MLQKFQNRININKILFWTVLLIGVFVRFYKLGIIPQGVNGDEAMGAVDAYALATYGTDRFGTRFPVHFNAWGVGQMSVFLSYLQAVAIKFGGFSTTVIRIPIALLSILGMLSVWYMCKKFFSDKVALLAFFLTAICPWHLIQSRWAIDCNAYPHIFITGLCLLVYGLENRKWQMYLSMVFFALTFYCYGVAIYTVPVFLIVFSIYLLATKKINVLNLFVCVMIFLVVALPEIMVMLINGLGLDTVSTPLFTMQFFPDSVRKADILIVNFSFEQLTSNLKAMYSVLVLQTHEAWFNNAPKYGSVYPVTPILALLGFVSIIDSIRKKKHTVLHISLLVMVFCILWTGTVTKTVNVNRINIAFYPILILASLGVFFVKDLILLIFRNGKSISAQKAGSAAVSILILGYVFMGVMFFRLYFGKYEMLAGDLCFNTSYLEAIKYVDDNADNDVLYITCYTGYGADMATSEILTNYITAADALYLQGKSNSSAGRELLPYKERYNYFYSWDDNDWTKLHRYIDEGKAVSMLVRDNELEYIDFSYEVVDHINEYSILKITE